jgi:hypothetical protein
MSQTPNLHRFGRIAQRLRGLWLAVTFLFLAVQLGLPAHQASHPIGQSDLTCGYCMLGAHSPGMPGLASLSLPPAAPIEAPRSVLIRPAAAGLLRKPSSRAPPSVVHA